jgi:class 3 adenylate cyclase
MTFAAGRSSVVAAAARAIAGGRGAAPVPDTSLPAGERRQLTVLFCDVVGSTARAARLDKAL